MTRTILLAAFVAVSNGSLFGEPPKDNSPQADREKKSRASYPSNAVRPAEAGPSRASVEPLEAPDPIPRLDAAPLQPLEEYAKEALGLPQGLKKATTNDQILPILRELAEEQGGEVVSDPNGGYAIVKKDEEYGFSLLLRWEFWGILIFGLILCAMGCLRDKRKDKQKATRRAETAIQSSIQHPPTNESDREPAADEGAETERPALSEQPVGSTSGGRRGELIHTSNPRKGGV